MEPENILAIYNRAILLDKTGDLRAAIRDYTRMIDQFPNFWNGLARRASCYRRLGMTAKAELDEFRIFKAQNNKHLGIQPRWSAAKRKQMRRRSEIDPDKYNQIVVADEQTAEHEYKSDYRGRVQNRATAMDALPMYHLSYMQYASDVHTYHAFAPKVEAFNNAYARNRRIYVSCAMRQMDERQSRAMLSRVDSLTAVVERTRDEHKLSVVLQQRAVAESVVQNYDAAISDLTACLGIDSTSVLALWQRAYCQTMMNEFDLKASSATAKQDPALKTLRVIADLDRAIQLDADNQYLYYNRGCANLTRKDYMHAIDDFTRAVNIDPNLAEAYYNRGLARVHNGLRAEGIADLSKAGELGLYSAYSVIKRVSTVKQQNETNNKTK